MERLAIGVVLSLRLEQAALFGDARDARLFGMMGAITLTAALMADILFLPALLKRFMGGRQRSD